MTTTSISELKARLSAYLDAVRQGDEVLVTDRGRVIARLSPVTGDLLEESRRELLIRSGRVRPPTRDHRPSPRDVSECGVEESHFGPLFTQSQ